MTADTPAAACRRRYGMPGKAPAPTPLTSAALALHRGQSSRTPLSATTFAQFLRSRSKNVVNSVGVIV